MQGGHSETVDGQLINRNLQPFISFQGPMQSFARFGVGDRKEYWNGVTYDLQGAFVFGQFRPRSGLNINMQIQRGEQIDYTNSRLADQRRFQPQIDWNATRHLLVRLRYTSDRLSSKEGPTVYNAKLTDLRLTWQFNVRSFVRLTLQDQDIERNVDLYANRLTDPNTSSLAHAASVFLQAESADGAVRRLLRQQPRGRHHARARDDGTHAVLQAELRLDAVKRYSLNTRSAFV